MIGGKTVNSQTMLKGTVKEVLSKQYPGLPDNHDNYWRIDNKYVVENQVRLVNVHYNHDFEETKETRNVSSFRGIVIDIKEKRIIVSSYGKSDEIIAHHILKEKDSDLQISGTISDKIALAGKDTYVSGVRDFKVSMENIRIRPGLEGIIIRFFKWNGIVFFSTYKKIDAKKSFLFGTLFTTMFNTLSDMKTEDYGKGLFGTEQTSPHAYYFLMPHSGFKTVSSVADDTIRYIGCLSSYTDEKLPQREFKDFPKAHIVEHEDISVYEANNFLFPDKQYVQVDEKLLPGELALWGKGEKKVVRYGGYDGDMYHGDFVIIETKDGRVYEVKSDAYIYRKELLGRTEKERSVDKGYFAVTDFYRGNKDLRDALLHNKNHYPSAGPYIKWRNVKNPEDRVAYWTYLYFNSLNPIYRRNKTPDSLNKRFISRIRNVVGFITVLSRLGQDEYEQIFSNFDETKVKPKLQNRVNTLVRKQEAKVNTFKLLKVEMSSDLYRLVKMIERYQRLFPQKIAPKTGRFPQETGRFPQKQRDFLKKSPQK